MNQPDRFDECDDDATMETLFSPLRQVQPPDVARQAIRANIAAELNRTPPTRPRTPWWRRSIEVPVPVALAAALVVLVSAGWKLLAPQAAKPPAAQPQATSPAPAPAVTSTPDAIAAVATDSASPQGVFYSTEVYVCGVGPISSVSGYSFREEDHVP